MRKEHMPPHTHTHTHTLELFKIARVREWADERARVHMQMCEYAHNLKKNDSEVTHSSSSETAFLHVVRISIHVSAHIRKRSYSFPPHSD